MDKSIRPQTLLYLLAGTFVLFAVLASRWLMAVNYNPRDSFQAQTSQSPYQHPIIIAQQTIESAPSVESGAAAPTQSFIHSPFSGQNSSPDTNFVEIMDSVNSTDSVNAFPEDDKLREETIEEPGPPSIGEDSPFIELK